MTIPAGFAEATFIFRAVGATRDATWTLGLDSDNFGIQNPTDIAIIVYGSFTGTGKPYLAANMEAAWTFQGVSVTMQYEEGPLSGEYISPVAGSTSSGALPSNCAMLISKSTGLGGRRNRGRAYIPPVGPGESTVDALGIITSGVRTAFQGWYDAAIDSMAAAEVRPMLFHQSAPFTPALITSMTVEPRIATQRRRMRR